jgi:hypothetical protein
MSTAKPNPAGTPTNPPAMVWTGRVISALPALALLASGVMKFLPATPEMEKGLNDIGWKQALVVPLGITELICTVLYIIPQTSVLGAILITGYMGGAIATHVRVGDPFYVQATIGVLAWLGLFLRDARLRSLLPLRTLS